MPGMRHALVGPTEMVSPVCCRSPETSTGVAVKEEELSTPAATGSAKRGRPPGSGRRSATSNRRLPHRGKAVVSWQSCARLPMLPCWTKVLDMVSYMRCAVLPGCGSARTCCMILAGPLGPLDADVQLAAASPSACPMYMVLPGCRSAQCSLTLAAAPVLDGWLCNSMHCLPADANSQGF